MPVWKRKIQIRDLLSDDISDESVRRTAVALVERLKCYFPDWANDLELEQVIDEMGDIARTDSVGDDVFGGRFSLVDWFNAVLEDLWNWCDRERVWVKLEGET